MPYIAQMDRAKVNQQVDNLMLAINNECAGEPKATSELCTYAITRLLVCLFDDKPWYYRMDAVKCLESAKDEFMQTRVRPYEQHKREVNGDVL